MKTASEIGSDGPRQRHDKAVPVQDEGFYLLKKRKRDGSGRFVIVTTELILQAGRYVPDVWIDYIGAA